MRGLGLPTKYALWPVVSSIGAVNARQAGIIPCSEGPVISGFVPISFAPSKTKRTRSQYAFVIIVACLADNDIIRVDVVHDNALFVKRIHKTGFTDYICGTVRLLL